jgi:hypothetical protein
VIRPAVSRRPETEPLPVGLCASVAVLAALASWLLVGALGLAVRAAWPW